MKWLLAILVVVILGGCTSHSGYSNGTNPFQAFSDGYNQSRDRRYNRNSERLQKQQLQYYRQQNLNQYRNY